MSKPVDIDALLRTMAQLLGGERIEAPQEASATERPAAAPEKAPAAPAEPLAPVLSRLAGQARLRPIIAKFVDRLRGRLAEIDEALRKQDAQNVASFAHWLKGSAATMGYDAFTEPALALEEAAKAGELERAAQLLGVVRGLAERVVAPGGEPAAA
jgi:HPt (histidine-containing phosphotransfer) domain-containing protein